MADQQTPSSSNYHKWLTPAQYADRFGLSQNDINKITTWLKAQGFTVISVGGGRNSIIFSGTAMQIEAAFQTQLHRYNIDGEEHFSNATPVKIPAAWSGVVTGVRGLNSFHWKAMGVKNQLHRNYYFSDMKYSSQFIAPGDAATIYDINPLYNATSMVKWRWVRSSISIRRGGHHVRPTQSRSATVALGRRGLRAADGQALAHSDVRGHSRHWTPYDLQSAPRHPRAGSRPSLQLSPRLLAAPLVVVALGPRLGRSHPAPLGPRGLRRAGRR